jgi:arsenate reductase
MTGKINLLFLCTGNSCRSQMAEGLCRQLKGDSINAFSAGIEQHGLNPLAVMAMQEISIDISGQQSKTVHDLGGQSFDYVVAVCGHADETCPAFPGNTRRVFRGFDDPPKLARGAATEEDALVHYRRVRDEIRAYIETLPDTLPGFQTPLPD